MIKTSRRNGCFGLGRNERKIENAKFIVERSRYFGILDVIRSIPSITILSIGKDERGKGLQTPVYGKVNTHYI